MIEQPMVTWSAVPGPAMEEFAPQEEFACAHRVASAQIGVQELSWLSKGFAAFLANGGAVPLERCLRLPSKDGGLRRALRDYWLRRAWRAIDGDASPWQRSEMLAAAIRGFSARQWTRWRTRQEAPAEAGKLEAALFHVFRSCDRVPTSAMQLHNIAHQRRHS